MRRELRREWREGADSTEETVLLRVTVAPDMTTHPRPGGTQPPISGQDIPISGQDIRIPKSLAEAWTRAREELLLIEREIRIAVKVQVIRPGRLETVQAMPQAGFEGRTGQTPTLDPPEGSEPPRTPSQARIC